MTPKETSVPDIKLRTAPDGRVWACSATEQVHLPSYTTNVCWDVRDPEGVIVASGMRDSVKAAHNSALAACKRRWGLLDPGS